MKNNIKTQVYFWALLIALKIIFDLIYGRKIELIEASIYYFIIATIVFLFYLIPKRKTRWIVFISLFLIPITLIVFIGRNALTSSFEVLYTSSEFNVPFLGGFYLNFKSYFLRILSSYSLFFLLGIFYYYGIHLLAKKLALKI